jgi:Glycosyltransferase sugar-binding region containing DXD motif
MRIPRVFHRIWLGDQPMPQEFVDFGDTWRRLHPNWEFVLWTEENLPEMANRWVFDATQSLAGKANVLRYEILLRYGGVYIDTDFECKRNLEPLIADIDCFVARQPDDIINNAIIGAVPGHPFLQKVVSRLNIHACYVLDEVPSVTQSGPYFLTKVAANFPGLTIFDSALFYPYEWHERWRRHEEFPNAYAIHHWTLSARSVELPTPRTFGDGKKASLAVLIVPDPNDDGSRLQWALEGLRIQTVNDIEVFVIDVASRDRVRSASLELKSHGVSVRLIDRDTWKLGPARLVDLCNSALARARASRLMVLDGACVPDPDLVETHAKFGSRPVVPFGFRRVYPPQKFYQLRRPLDLQGLYLHSEPDPRRSNPYPPFFGDWRDSEGYTLSAPKWALESVGGFSGSKSRIDFRDLAFRLSGQKLRLLPQWRAGLVTHLTTGLDG